MLYSRFFPQISMLPDYKSRCPSLVPLLQPQRRKYLFGAIGIFVLIVGILLIVFIVTSSSTDSFVLDRTPLFAGRNNLPVNLAALLANNFSAFDFNTNLTNDKNFTQKCPHCDTDIPRLKKGQVSSQFLVIHAGSTKETQISDVLIQLEYVQRFISKYSSSLQLVKKNEDLDDVFDNNKIGNMIAVEGGQFFTDNTTTLPFLRLFYKQGVRALTLSNKCNQSDHDAPADYIFDGKNLTDFGTKVVNEMNNLGMIIDIQGLSDELQKVVINASSVPVMISNTASQDLDPSPDNVNNDTLDAIKTKNGLILITFDKNHYGKSKPTFSIENVTAHINYIVNNIGFDNIAIGGDYDSKMAKPQGLEDVSCFPQLFKQLQASKTKWSASNLDKLAGLNFRRFFEDVEKGRNVTKLNEE